MQALIILIYCAIVVIAAYCGSREDHPNSAPRGLARLFAVRQTSQTRIGDTLAVISRKLR